MYTYTCTHGEVQNANGCWSATLLVSNMQLLVRNTGYICTYIFTCTNGHQQKYGKNGKLSVFFHISPYSTCICYFIEKTCMYAMKKCIEEYQDHAVEIHTFAMNVLLGQLQKRAWQVHNNALESYT